MTTRHPIGACTSTTATASATTTRASRSTRSSSTHDADDDGAHGTVEFPISYEGPPGLVHGGFLAVFFDCVFQELNCALGLAGKTAELSVRFRRPTPLLTPLTYRAERIVDDRPHHRARRAAPGRRPVVRGAPARGQGRPCRAARDLAPPPMSTTVSRVLRAHVAERPDAEYRGVRRRPAHLCRRRAPQPRARPWAARGGCRARQPDRTAVPDRGRLRARVVGRGAHRRDRRAHQHVLHVPRAA